MKCLYIYSNPEAPQDSLGFLALNPLAIEESLGEYTDVSVRGAIKPLAIESEHFTLVSDDPEVIREFESTSVYSGFNPLLNLS